MPVKDDQTMQFFLFRGVKNTVHWEVIFVDDGSTEPIKPIPQTTTRKPVSIRHPETHFASS
jgi:hypothetical protein